MGMGAFHAGNRGSNPLGDATKTIKAQQTTAELFVIISGPVEDPALRGPSSLSSGTASRESGLGTPQ